MNTYHLSGQEYDLQYQGYKEDLGFYLKETKKAKSAQGRSASGGKVLEIGCGTGRILLPILKAGVNIEGLDGSKSLLQTLHFKAKKIGLKPKTYFANMINFDLGKKYDLIIIPFRTFIHLATVSDQKKALKIFHKHLSKGGKLILNFFNPDFKRMVERQGKEEFHSYVRNPITKNKVKISAINCYYPAEQLMKIIFIHEEVDKHNYLLRKKEYKTTIKYIFRFEFEHLLELTDFRVLKLFGGFKGEKFDDRSREMVWIAEKV